MNIIQNPFQNTWLRKGFKTKIQIYSCELILFSLVLPLTLKKQAEVNVIRPLNFQTFQFKLKEEKGKTLIYDEIRAKFVVLTPEEWVRQHCICYLNQLKKVPLGLIAVEKGISINGKRLRYDAVVYSRNRSPMLLVECKAPDVAISQETFQQIATYNMHLNVPFLWVTNGVSHYFCKIDFDNKAYQFLPELPDFDLMSQF